MVRGASCTTSMSTTPTRCERADRRFSVRFEEMTDSRALRSSATFPPEVIHEIQRAANEGVYAIRGFGAKRRVPSFDDLLMLGASVSRYPLEGYREACDTGVILGTRFAKNPVHLRIPITIAGMSFGALGANAKEALGLAATQM